MVEALPNKSLLCRDLKFTLNEIKLDGGRRQNSGDQTERFRKKLFAKNKLQRL
jgi:hypothetical protein